MIASPALNYSPPEGHTPIGSPAPSQMFLHRGASPNHLSQHSYVDSPRSVPTEYSQYNSGQTEHFEYENTPELFVNDDSHIYDFGPIGALPDPQFVQPDLSQADTNNLLFM